MPPLSVLSPTLAAAFVNTTVRATDELTLMVTSSHSCHETIAHGIPLRRRHCNSIIHKHLYTDVFAIYMHLKHLYTSFTHTHSAWTVNCLLHSTQWQISCGFRDSVCVCVSVPFSSRLFMREFEFWVFLAVLNNLYGKHALWLDNFYKKKTILCSKLCS